MLVLMTVLKDELAKLNSTKDILHFLIEQPLVSSNTPEVATASISFLTLTVTSANVE